VGVGALTAVGLLGALRSHGVHLALDGDRVRLVAPRPPPAELVAQARAAKAELVLLLRGEHAGDDDLDRDDHHRDDLDRDALVADRDRLLGRIAEIEALGHHEGRWVRGSRVPPEAAHRLKTAATGALAALREDLARVESALGCAPRGS